MSQSHRRPWLGYAMVLTAATLFALNGVVAKVALSSGLSSLRLTEVRLTGAAIGLLVASCDHPAGVPARNPA